MKNKNLYHCDRNFYWLKETPKQILIDWIPHYNCDGAELDQSVPYKNLRVRKDNSSKHCLKDWQEGDKEFLIYPWRSGQPFYFEPATKEHINKEIDVYYKLGISDKYYQNLLKIIL